MKYCITQYAISKCHYGRKPTTEDDDRTQFGELIGQFASWAKSVENLGKTALAGRRIFVKDCDLDGEGHYAFVLWFAMSESPVSYALKLDAKPGDAIQIDTQTHKKGFIPGCPLYFYVNSKAPFVYTIRPEAATINGKVELEEAFRDYMGWYATGVQMPLTKENGEMLVSMPAYNHPIFSLQLGVEATEKDVIVNHADEIYKLVHVVRPSQTTQGCIRRFANAMANHLQLGVKFHKVLPTNSIRYEMDVSLDKDDILSLLEREGELRETERIGFKRRGTKGNVIWLNRALLRQVLDLKIASKQQILTAKGILKTCKELTISGGEQ